MAREIIERGVCDYCGQDAAEAYTISVASKTVVLDVCDVHAGPLREALSKGSEQPQGRGTRRQVDRPAQHRFRPVD